MKCHVYIVQEKAMQHKILVNKRVLLRQSNSPVKVGVANNVKKRIGSLQTANPRKILLLSEHGPFSTKEAYSIESQLHDRIKQYHIRGEWFDGRCLPTLKILIDAGFVSGKVASIREAKERMSAESRVVISIANKAERRFQRRLAMNAMRLQ